ncbi:MAG: hypothetical protein UW46_C0004G0088 [Candidatus Yanofskybacteria bacterium GW2011_GWF1_44_227]|uniref:Uncharacterized protein n=1 Tax=Candidatus Yanofskybacteria bacterium GW2011_GWE2_40_11 TaxID=1619033 RepID=A0A0G0QTQ4_9BACT|nr:MAG: hypothetical protein UT69_C0009G0021 [Candidatus Yanofskybacteria bacterium GW2011_GWE1_40_10]KKR40701.1 MAG: hypothetical protein UT75_C0005G0009 [Candidatus Yanofskybacteria bacterium GW2011_GWE2_40_11]KKT15589.1 MAG: hypothetical protein UV97_C0004G0005 [Candidatus Yanofskybacteria bacterium GW2011_GWF2_43_596]KKT53361.1 MAG: hypothetical protein UW46_C0004G0088 [Candidatus Yanofskybacteria bacterium GW2011_GWF1_44_227]OGN37409.1 MAG: hypothetical protein A2371_00375 [Candidatus Yano
MNLGNKLILLLVLPFLMVFALAFLFLKKTDLSEYGISAKILDAQDWIIEINPFDGGKLAYDKYEDIPLFECKPEDVFSKELKAPISIEWIGKTRSIMQSGNYYAFEKVPEDPSYPLFGGQFPEGETPDLSGIYRIRGEMRSIDCGDYSSIYGSTAHPEIDIIGIDKIE